MAALATNSSDLAVRLLALSYLAAVTLAIAARTQAKTPAPLDSDYSLRDYNSPPEPHIDHGLEVPERASFLSQKQRKKQHRHDELYRKLSQILDQTNCGKFPDSPKWPELVFPGQLDDWRRRSHGSGGQRMIGGNEVIDARQFPAYVEVAKVIWGGRKPQAKLRRTCGGVILSDRVVLTAGHCFREDYDNTVGQLLNYTVIATPHPYTDFNSQANSGKQHARVVRACHAQEFYGCTADDENLSARPWDIGILILDKNQSLQFNDQVQPACLPRRSYIDDATDRAEFPLYQLGASYQAGPRAKSKWNLWPNSVKAFKNVRPVKCSPDMEPRWPVACFELPRTFELVDGNKTERYGKLCQGDSGAPMLTVDENRRLTVVSIVSVAYDFCNDTKIDKKYSIFYSTDIRRIVSSFSFYEMLKNCTRMLDFE